MLCGAAPCVPSLPTPPIPVHELLHHRRELGPGLWSEQAWAPALALGTGLEGSQCPEVEGHQVRKVPWAEGGRGQDRAEWLGPGRAEGSPWQGGLALLNPV